MEPGNESPWVGEHRNEARRQRRAGGDPFERQARRQASRERLLLAGATVAMGVVVSTFYAVLIR